MRPKAIPCKPPFKTFVKLIPAPNVKPTNGIKIFPAGDKIPAFLYQYFQ